MINQISKLYEKALVLGNNSENENQVPDCITILISFYQIFNPFFSGGYRKRFPRCDQQSDQGLCQVLIHAQIHDLQLIPHDQQHT